MAASAPTPEQVSGVVATAMDAIVTVDGQQRIVLFNEAATRMFRLPAHAAMGQPLDLLIPVANRSAHRAHVERYAQGDGAARPMGAVRALTGRRADGTEFPIEATISRVGQGSELLLTVMVRDVTEVRDAERARLAHLASEAANRAKNDFLSRMSHELRTPLNAVLGMAQLLQAGLESRLSASEQRQFDVLQAAGLHLRTLIDDVLDLSRLQAGETHIEPLDVDLHAQIASVLHSLGAAAQAHQVTLQAPPPAPHPHPLMLRADPARLRQVLTHLVSNGIKYNRPGGWVRLGVEGSGREVNITVADNGLGMDAQQLAALCEPFNRLGRERSGVDGAGIGMALTRHLVTLMGGRLAVESVEGAGSQVKLTLPAHASQSEPAGTVLYIEDNAVNALLVVELLRQWPQVRVVVADTGANGVAQAALLQPRLVLLDMHLPDMTGLQVLEQLRRNPATRHLQVAALSANAMPHDIEQARQAGACAYWTKPIDFTPFLQNVRGLLLNDLSPEGSLTD